MDLGIAATTAIFQTTCVESLVSWRQRRQPETTSRVGAHPFGERIAGMAQASVQSEAEVSRASRVAPWKGYSAANFEAAPNGQVQAEVVAQIECVRRELNLTKIPSSRFLAVRRCPGSPSKPAEST